MKTYNSRLGVQLSGFVGRYKTGTECVKIIKGDEVSPLSSLKLNTDHVLDKILLLFEDGQKDVDCKKGKTTPISSNLE